MIRQEVRRKPNACVPTLCRDDIACLLVALRQWDEEHLFNHGERHPEFIDKRTGKRTPFMAPTAKDGSVLTPNMTVVRKVT